MILELEQRVCFDRLVCRESACGSVVVSQSCVECACEQHFDSVSMIMNDHVLYNIHPNCLPIPGLSISYRNVKSRVGRGLSKTNSPDV